MLEHNHLCWSFNLPRAFAKRLERGSLFRVAPILAQFISQHADIARLPQGLAFLLRLSLHDTRSPWGWSTLAVSRNT
jgi:hypothetical protein